MSPELQRLDAAADALSAAFDELNAAAMAYARAETVAYSKAHPRRKVTFCAAMGSTCLHVQPGGTLSDRHDYQVNAHEPDIGKPPAFLEKLNDIESEFNIQYALGGDLNLDCRGGEILRELTEW